MKYTLFNPMIQGAMETVYVAQTPRDGALQAWASLSKYMATPVSSFAITLEGDDNQLYHYNITEKMIGHNINYHISPIQVRNISPGILREKMILVTQQFGGESKSTKNDELDLEDPELNDEFDDDDDEIRGSVQFETNYSMYSSPITHFMYNPMVYETLSIFHVPTFIASVQPVMEIYTVTDFWTH